MQRQLAAAVLAVLGTVSATQAALLTFPDANDDSTFTYTTLPAETSGNVVQMTLGVASGSGNKEDDINFNTLSLAPGTYTFGVDVNVTQAFSYFHIEAAPNNQNIDNPVWAQQPVWSTIGTGQWVHVSGTVTVASSTQYTDANWVGHFQIKAGIYANSGDAGGTGNLMIDNVTLTDANNNKLTNYTFDSDTPGQTPANTTVYGVCNSNGLGNPTWPTGTLLVQAVPEPASAALLVLGAAGLGLRRRREVK